MNEAQKKQHESLSVRRVPHAYHFVFKDGFVIAKTRVKNHRAVQ